MSLTDDQIRLALKDAIDVYLANQVTPNTFMRRIIQIYMAKDWKAIKSADWFDMTEEYKKLNCKNYKISWWTRLITKLYLKFVILKRS